MNFNGYADNDRRFKVVYLHSHVLLNCLINHEREPNMTCVKVSLDDVPVGTRVVDRHYDHLRACEGFVLYHRDWPSVPLGQSIPQLHTSHSYVEVKLDEPNARTTQPIRSKYPNGHFTTKEQAMAGKPMQMNTVIEDKASGKVAKYETTLNVKFLEPKSYPSLRATYDPEKQATVLTDGKGNQAIVKDSHPMVNNLFDMRNAPAPKTDELMDQEQYEREKEFFHEKLGTLHTNPFDKTWRDKPPML